MARITQEFYCNDCDGFFFIKLNTALNVNIKVACPNCGRYHPRHVQNGLIYECHLAKYGTEEIEVPRSAYHKTSVIAPKNAREGVTFDPALRALWVERHGSKVA